MTPRRPHPVRLLACALLALAAAVAHGEPEAGQIYIHTARGGTTISGNTGTAKPLARGETFQAGNQTISVPDGQPLAFVLSNGVAGYLPSGGRLSFESFTQEPVDITAKDREYEPSRSALGINLAQGQLALAGRKSVPTSTVTLTTPLAKFQCLSQSFIAQVQGDTVTFTLLDGTAEITIPETGFKETLQANQTAVITRQNLRQAYPLKMSNLNADTDLKNRLNRLMVNARWAEQRVDFVRGEDKQLHARLVVPADFILQMSTDETRFR